jgi:hypothetical protein
MNIDRNKLQRTIRVAGLLAACAFVLGLVVFGTAASSPNPRRDVSIDFPADIAVTTPADRTPVAGAPGENRDVSFVNRTNVVEYPFHLDNETDVVRLNLSVEVEHGLVRWELVDPAGVVRSNIRTTERARMDDTELTGMQGKWLLRMNFEDATGRYHISWSR